MKPYIIVINGPATSGKDTFMGLFRRLMWQNTDNISYVDGVKKLVSNIITDKDEKARKFLATITTAWEEYDNGPMQNLEFSIEHFIQSSEYKKGYPNEREFLFVCCRESKHIQYLKEKYGACTLLIVRPGVEPIESNEADKNVLDFRYDYTISNDGTLDQLQDKAYEFYRFLRDHWQTSELPQE